MVLLDLGLTSLPAVVGVILTVCLVYVLALCVCGKTKKSLEGDGDVELQDVTANPNSAAVSDSVRQSTVNDTTGVHLEIETAVTPLNTSFNSQNGTLHSRGNSVDLNKIDHQSATSAGSSPRPNTLSRELPDIPSIKSQTLSHSHLPEVPPSGRSGALTLDSHHRGHGQLPDIPVNGRAATLTASESHRGGHSQLPELPHNHPTSLNSSKGSNHSAVSVSTNNGARPKAGSPGSLRSSDRTSTASMDDYDHINETKRQNRPRSDYDHVVIEGDTKRIIPAKQRLSDYNDYAEVKNENIYEGVPEDVTVVSLSKPNVTSIKVGSSPRKATGPVKLHKVDSNTDPYNLIKGDDAPYNKTVDDPYNKIKTDDPYNRVKDDDPYNRVKDTDVDDLDPYDSPVTAEGMIIAKLPDQVTKLQEDPYAFVIDEERNVSNQTDPYARVVDTESEIDDPYNKVIDDNDSTIITSNIPEEVEDSYSTVKKNIDVEYAKVNKNLTRENQSANVTNQRLENDPTIIPSTSRGTVVSAEYATVQKMRTFSEAGASDLNPDGAASDQDGNRNVGDEGLVRLDSNAQTPPEPPRGYVEDVEQDNDHYNTLTSSLENNPNQNSTAGSAASQPDKKREPPYNKLSVRESLASMNARIASNPYEYVSEVDNLYATVDGSSGDGVIRDKAAEKRESTSSEYYTEIEGATAAPAPPSLDSLHETAKHHQEERQLKSDESVKSYGDQGHSRTPSGPGHQRTPSGHDHSIVGHQRTPSGQGQMPGSPMTSSYEGPIAMVTQQHAILNNDYQDVMGEKISDENSEFDPNYETVEEAKSKVKYEEINGAAKSSPKLRNHIYEEADTKRKYEVINGTKTDSNPKIRAHVYEEVTVTNEARRVRQRVLSQHTYEDLTDVKGQLQGKSGNSKQQKEKENGTEVQRRKKGHERSLSGELSWFGKRKSGEMKDKQRDSKKRSEVKDKENRKSGDRSSKL